MSSIRLENIKKTYPNGFVAVKDFNLDIEDKEFVIFVGPSGCGKSTTLRMVAGLEEISEGAFYVDGRLMNNIAPKDRDIAMVFQNYALYPHMTAYDNIAFGLKLRKTPKAEIKRKVHEAAALLEIEDLLDKKPRILSGGQRQRVAMGRAIVREPKVFLMDEPLSNLDAKLRVQMRTVISRLHQKLQTTFIYVTHDQTEAMTLGTRIVVMRDGVIMQTDTPHNLYNKPNNLFVAGFIGSPPMNFINAVAERVSAENFTLRFSGGNISFGGVRSAVLEEKGCAGKDVILGIRPEDLKICDFRNTADNTNMLEAHVEITELLGAETLLYINIGDDNSNIIVRANPDAAGLRGQMVRLSVNPDKIHIFDNDTEEAIL